jgi:hypothetical protein
MAVKQAGCQFVFAVSKDRGSYDDFVAGNTMNGVAPPINLGARVFDDYAPETMLGIHGHPSRQE